MVRNKNVDIIRALALALVLIYHCWVLTGSAAIPVPILRTLLPLGGEVGVTTFFVLSGFGIYYSLQREDQKGTIAFRPFMAKRLKRILPQYYLCLLVVLLFTESAAYLDPIHLPDILAHVFLVHNLVPEYHGAINGVLWTMGVIFQFYLVAIPLYRGMKKFGGFFLAAGVIFTIGCKALIYRYGLPMLFGEENIGWYAFWAGRQLPTALDNFLFGMGFAWFISRQRKERKNLFGILGCVISFGALILVCKSGSVYGIHTNNISGYFWHSEVAACIGLLIYFAYNIKVKRYRLFSRAFLWLAKYEYGIYLWHLVMIANILKYSGLVQRLLNHRMYLAVYGFLSILSIGIGYLFTKMISNAPKVEDYKKKWYNTDDRAA